MSLNEEPLDDENGTVGAKTPLPNAVSTLYVNTANRSTSKLNPVSAFSVGESSSQDELSKMVFAESPVLITAPPSVVVFPSTASCTSSSSSVCSTKNASQVSHVNTELNAPNETNASNVSVVSHDSPTPFSATITQSTERIAPENPFQDKVSSEESEGKTTFYSYMPNGDRLPIRHTFASREGRAKQRWDRCPITNRLIRLTTGCVPITNDGRILFVSSARKKEWILPKGGWELDERMEESAVRETYEEAGILGTLGPKLSEITFETRKGKDRRLESLKKEAHTQETKLKLGSETQTRNSSKQNTAEIQLSKDDVKVYPMSEETPISHVALTTLPENVKPHKPDNGQKEESVKNNDISSAFELNKVHSQDTSCKKPPYGMCRMILFPLYVSDVLDKWPENGRSRKVFSIDDAIRTTRREELRTILTEVKRRNLHLAGTIANKNDMC